jgi:hypothetical protein
MASPSQRLVDTLAPALPVFAAAGERLWTSPRPREIYPVYLATMHMIFRANTALLKAARARARALTDRDVIAGRLAAFLTRQMYEEEDEDLGWLEDLGVTGVDRSELLGRPPSPAVASLVGAQYYWLHHHHPIALLGYTAALVSLSPPQGFADQLRALTGYPRAAFRSVARTESQVPLRRRMLHGWLDRLPLTAAHEAAIGQSALHSLDAGIDVLREIHDRVVPAASATQRRR